MAGGIVRVTDANICGGRALLGVPSVRVNGLPVVVTGSPVSPHPNFKPPHTSAQTIATTNHTVRAGGIPIVTMTDIDTCGHMRGLGSVNVRIGS